MPITEIVRALLELDGVVEGRPARASLTYDVDGCFGADEAALGWPRFWLRVLRDGTTAVHGPFEAEDDALAAAAALGFEVP